MLNTLDDAIQQMKKFIEERDKAQEELKKERNPKLKDLLEKLYKNFLKEQREEDAIQQMKKFIEERDKAQEELNKRQEIQLAGLLNKLDNFRNRNEDEVISKKEEELVIDKKISDIKKAAMEVVSR
jgi:hypothetical protein